MDIRFRCTSVSGFNQAKGAYENCNQLLQVSADNVGLKVRCPRCNQMTVVPDKQKKRGPDRGEAEASTHDGRETVAQVQASMSYGKFNRATRCPKCGSLLDDEKNCTACRYKTPQVKVSNRPVKDMNVQIAGFQLWFTNIMSDGVGAKVFETVLHTFLSVIVMALMIFALVMGGTAAIVVVVAAILLGFLYVMVVIHTKRMASVPGAKLPFYMKPFWLVLLKLARMQKWTGYDSRLKNRSVIDVRGQAFGDRDLLDLEGLNVCSVLDAEGSSITDNSLAAMHGLKHLRCLVVRKTHVTNEAVFRLQQSLPKCWIWH